jgi:catechol 2,3-dioxygenase-like lactoylglutathione lyase family enzyme
MKRFHVHVAVDDLKGNIRFYSKIFAIRPAVIGGDSVSKPEGQPARTSACCVPNTH